MSFIYPRTVKVSRPNPQPGVGAQDYGGVTAANESPVAGAQGLPASIQAKRYRGKPYGETPTDAPERVGYEIFIALADSPLGMIDEDDIVTDDLGDRYQVIGAYWNSLGYKLITEKLLA